MKHKADIGRCRKHTVDEEPVAMLMEPDECRVRKQSAPTKIQFRNFLALGMIQPSLSPWASGIVMARKTNGEFFCGSAANFAPLTR